MQHRRRCCDSVTARAYCRAVRLGPAAMRPASDRRRKRTHPKGGDPTAVDCRAPRNCDHGDVVGGGLGPEDVHGALRRGDRPPAHDGPLRGTAGTSTSATGTTARETSPRPASVSWTKSPPAYRMTLRSSSTWGAGSAGAPVASPISIRRRAWSGSTSHLAGRPGRDPGVEAVVMDATRLGFASGSVDAVVALEAAQHFDTRAAFLGEALRVLRPGGTIALADMLFTDRSGQNVDAPGGQRRHHHRRVCAGGDGSGLCRRHRRRRHRTVLAAVLRETCAATQRFREKRSMRWNAPWRTTCSHSRESPDGRRRSGGGVDEQALEGLADHPP